MSMPVDEHLSWLPWAEWNLSRNPFGELTRQERASLAEVDLDPIVAFANQANRAVQLIGPCGHGKSTHLYALAERLPDASYVHIAADRRCPPVPTGMPLLIDEAQRLVPRVRRRLWASNLPMILATHRDLSGSLRRSGYLVDTQVVSKSMTPQRMYRLLNRRIDASRLSHGDVPEVSMQLVERLMTRFGCNVRAVEDYLYETFQALMTRTRAAEHGEMRHSN